jgi:hypothetical protein
VVKARTVTLYGMRTTEPAAAWDRSREALASFASVTAPPRVLSAVRAAPMPPRIWNDERIQPG